jgi:hypothetical protein
MCAGSRMINRGPLAPFGFALPSSDKQFLFWKAVARKTLDPLVADSVP